MCGFPLSEGRCCEPKQEEIMQALIRLDHDTAYQRAKAALVELWNHRAEVELHAIEIKPYKKDRSTAQNNFYWGFVVDPLRKHIGCTPAEMHNELLGAVYGWKTITGLDGHDRQVPNRRTTEPEKMNVAEFSEYIEHCQRIAAEQGIYIEPFQSAA